MADEAGFNLMEPFDIDGDELAGIRPQVVFCLGYEWRQMQDLLDAGEEIHRPLHRENAERVKRMCIRRGRKFKVRPENEDWCWIDVEACNA